MSENYGRQQIILKADDMVYDPCHILPLAWERFIQFARVRKLRIGIGLIANSLEACDPSYLNRLKSLQKEGFVEFWNHGYDHLLGGTNEKGETVHEFQNSSYAFQKEHLLKSQELAARKLGLVLRSFGAPGNAVDENTIKVLGECQEIKVCLFGPPSNKLVLERRCNIEYPVFKPNYGRFIENYMPGKDYLVLQIHPKAWENDDFEQFIKIVDFLIEQRVEFVTPFELFLKLNR